MRLLRFGYFCTFLAVFAFDAGISRSTETASNWIKTDQSSLRLISSVDGVKGLDSLRIGLQIKLAPGWKTYWRSPGDTGIPPQLDWSGSENLKSAKISWPLPEQFEAYGFSSWGYHDEVVFPIDIALQEVGNPLHLKLRVQLGICEDVCIPYAHDFTLSLDARNAGPTEEASIIEIFSRRVPGEIGADGVALKEVDANSEGDRRFTVTVSAVRPFEDPSIIVEGKDGAYFDLVSSSLSEDRTQAVFELDGHLPAKSDRIAGQDIIVTIFDNGMAGEKHLRVD